MARIPVSGAGASRLSISDWACIGIGLTVLLGLSHSIGYRSGHLSGYDDGIAYQQQATIEYREDLEEIGFYRWCRMMSDIPPEIEEIAETRASALTYCVNTFLSSPKREG